MKNWTRVNEPKYQTGIINIHFSVAKVRDVSDTLHLSI